MPFECRAFGVDPGTVNVGVAFIRLGYKGISVERQWEIHLKGRNPRIAESSYWLYEFLKRFSPVHVVGYEDFVLPMKYIDIALVMYIGSIRAAAVFGGVSYLGMAPKRIRKYLMGDGACKVADMTKQLRSQEMLLPRKTSSPHITVATVAAMAAGAKRFYEMTGDLPSYLEPHQIEMISSLELK